MVHGSSGEEASLIETAASTAAPTTVRGKPRLSGSLSQLVLQAFEGASNRRKVLPVSAIKEFLAEAGYPVSKNSQRLKGELRSLVSHGLLVRVSGSGATGSFRLSGNQARGAGRSDPGRKKAGTPKKPAGASRIPQRKPRKKQPAVSKPRGPPSQTSVRPGKKPLKKHPARAAAAKKAAKRRT